MSFLHRQRPFVPAPNPTAPENGATTPIPFPPAVENIHVASQPHIISFISKGRKTSAGTIIRRVSTLLSGKKKRQPAFAPLDLQAPQESRWRVVSDGSSSPTESDVSFDDIRRPSGLGRAVSISSNRSLPPSPFSAVHEESPFHIATKVTYERARALSTPNLLRPTPPPKTNSALSSVTMARRNKDRPPPPMPHEVLIAILSYTPRHRVASHAATSRNWSVAARAVLYRILDLRTLRPKQIEELVTMLAYRHDLTDVVRSFECHAWPHFFPPPANFTGPHAPGHCFSPALTAVFTIAFQNMNLITSLVLPSFDHTFLRHHSAFGLKNFTILCHAMTSNETLQLFTWLNGQTNITHLAFPNLVDSINTPTETSPTIPKNSPSPSNTLTDCSDTYDTTPLITPSGSPVSSFALLSSTAPVSPFESLNLLPSLTSLVAPPSIVTSLITARHTVVPRPLDHVTLSINNTLYTGLRPATLLNTLHGINSLVLKFSSAVDRRSIGKALSTGAVLTIPRSTPSTSSVTETTESDTSSRAQVLLQQLEIQLSDPTDGADLALYKIISSSIPRYQGLVGLRCSFVPEPSPESNLQKEAPELTDRELALIAVWAKQCSSLQLIEMLSGARWKRVVEGRN